MESADHIIEAELEGYIRRTLPQALTATIAGHFLTCPACRERMEAESDFETAMRSASAKIGKIILTQRRRQN